MRSLQIVMKREGTRHMARYCGAPFVLCCAFYLYVLTCFFGLGDVHAAEPLPGWENNPSEATVRELETQE